MSTSSPSASIERPVRLPTGATGPTRARRRPGRANRAPRAVALFGPLTLFVLFTLLPLYWMVVYAVTPENHQGFLPWPLTFAHFLAAWNNLGFAFLFRNSAIVGGSTLVVTVILALAAGYALARFTFWGKKLLILALLCTQFVPGVVLLIPLFQIFKGLSLIDNLLSLVISDTVFQMPLAAVLMAGFIRNIPVNLEEAAMVDGCSRFRAFLVIMLPLLRPAIVATGSFAFIGSWNNFLFALMFMNSQQNFTIPVGLANLIGEYNVDYGALAAGGTIAAMPLILIFAFVQKYLVQGLTAGAVKG